MIFFALLANGGHYTRGFDLTGHPLGIPDDAGPNVTVEDISYRVAPSVLHVPFAITGFILKKIFRKDTLKLQSWKNLKGSLFALLSGLHMKSFGYYIITAKK